MNKIYAFIGGRKLTFAIVLTLINTYFVIAGHSTAAEWSNFEIWIFGTYASGNAIEHVAKGLKAKGNE